MNTREKFEAELNRAENRFSNLEVGNNQDSWKLTPQQIQDLCSEIEAANLDLSISDDVDKLAKIVASYENDTRLTIYYDGQAVAKILTNRTLSMDDALTIAGIDINEEDGGDPVWDYNLFSFDPARDF